MSDVSYRHPGILLEWADYFFSNLIRTSRLFTTAEAMFNNKDNLIFVKLDVFRHR